MNEKENLIMNYITKEECNYMCSDKLFDCKNCDSLEECYMRACEKCNSEFASNINYCDYNTEDNFWEQLFD